MPLLQFVPFVSSVDPGFWHAFTELKIDVLKLSDEPVPLRASYEKGKWVKDRETGEDVGLPGQLRLDAKAFGKDEEDASDGRTGRTVVRGLLKNFNTIEDFKKVDKQVLFNDFSDQLWSSLDDSTAPSFLLIAFADLKKYKYYYWFAFPAFVAKPAWEIAESEGWSTLPTEDAQKLHDGLSAGKSSSKPWLAKRSNGGEWEVEASLSKAENFFGGLAPTERYLVFSDPSTHAQAAGWPLRNVLAQLHRHLKSEPELRVISWRDGVRPADEAPSRSLVVTVKTASDAYSSDGSRPSALGWEKNNAGKLAPRIADLGPMMDPTRLADQAVDLNLKLMRWRILPALDLEKIASTRCLLLGAGTLGCYVARTLMAWGVRKITLLDSSKVSFSNPVRQPLFEFDDCLAGGKPKAAAAAAALKRIYPGVDATGIELAIPMPGHPIPVGSEDKAKEDVAALEKLFDEHDVIYLLMDSRESRWLPTLLGAAKGKLVMNAALGFDSYLVMRHGVPASGDAASASVPSEAPLTTKAIADRLGCYYCNDVVAPTDSLTDRTLDQMCTVTRPGLAAIASASAVELMASVLQHPEGIRALADTPTGSKAESRGSTVGSESVLGSVPHQIRGFLARFDNMKLSGPAYNKCTGCSDTVIEAYRQGGFQMLSKAFSDAKYLEQLTGLDKLYDESEAAMESLDWDEDEEAVSE